MSSLNRRDFIRSSSAAALAGGLASTASLSSIPTHAAKPAVLPKAETLVGTLFKSLNEEQKAKVCFPFDHKKRLHVDNNWRITDARVGKDFDADQQEMINEIFTNLHSPEYAAKVVEQIRHDGGGKRLSGCSVALFGEPGSGKFEFVLTGRHCTRRCDGDSVAGAAFGGPIFYGHAADGFDEGPDHKGNAYWFQALRANELFQALDGKQRKQGLVLERPRSEGETRKYILANKFDKKQAGIHAGAFSKDQKDLARKVMGDLLAPFRKEDRDESMKLVEKQGFDNLHFAWFKHGDIGEDGVWDVWQVEGPSMLWLFRGDPHVHTWVHIRDPKDEG